MELRLVALVGVFCALGCCPRTAFAQTASSAPPHPTATTHFDILAFQVLGSTKLSVPDIERAVYQFEGPKRSEADVESARAALQALYDKRGFPTVSVTIPEQDTRSGLITLQINEQRIGRLRVVGAKYFSPDDVQRNAPSLAEGQVPNFKDVQSDIVALNQLPDRRVTPEIKAGVAPGTVDVDLDVNDTLPLHGTLELNNRNSANTSPLRLTGTVHYDDLWQRGDSLSVTAQTAPDRPSDAEVFSASYLAHFGNSPFSLLTYAVRSDSNVAAISDFNVIGNGTLLGVRLVRNLPTREGFFQSVSFGIDDKNFNEDTVFGSTSSTAPIHYFPLSLAYNANWMHDNSTTQLGLTATANVGGLSDSDDNFDAKRFDAKADFFHLRLDGSRTLTFGGGYQFYTHVQAQFANEPLISNEEFSIGGLDTVRGFFESAALGDNGVAAQVEVRSRPFANEKDHVDNMRLIAFVDAGYARILDPLPEQLASDTLVSAGVGLTLRAYGHFNSAIDFAFPLSSPNALDASKREGVNALFRLWGEF
jgi:hemolysin activation/secretion protein